MRILLKIKYKCNHTSYTIITLHNNNNNYCLLAMYYTYTYACTMLIVRTYILDNFRKADLVQASLFVLYPLEVDL